MATKEFDLLLDGTYYERSGNPDTVYEWRCGELHLRGSEKSLENRIAQLTERIAAIGERATYPTAATIEQIKAIDRFNDEVPDKKELEEAKVDLMTLLIALDGI